MMPNVRTNAAHIAASIASLTLVVAGCMYRSNGSGGSPREVDTGVSSADGSGGGSTDAETDPPDGGGGVDGGGDGSIAAQFAGYWYTLDGEGTLDCGDDPVELNSGPEGEITDTGGGEFVFEFIDNDCSYTFDRDGRTATVRNPQECTTEDGTVKPLEWTLTLSEDGERIDQEYRDELTVGSGTDAQTCNVEWSGTLEPGPGPKAFVDSFTGTWEHTGSSASATYSCDQQDGFLASTLSDDIMVPDSLEITEGSEADLSILENKSECQWSAPVQFRNAEVAQGTTCKPPQLNSLIGDGGELVRTVGASTYELSEDGQQITHTYEGTVQLTSPEMQNESCDESWTLTYEPQ